MKAIITLILSFFILATNAQINHVIAGAELLNYGIVNLSLNSKIKWSSERTNKPGYFSAVENANFIEYSDAAHIDGYVKKYGNSGFVFPVGNGKTLMAFEMSAPEKSTDAYAVAWIEGDPSVSLDPTEPFSGKHPIQSFAGEITQVSAIGQWDWQVGSSENLGVGTTGNGNGLHIKITTPDLRNFAKTSELRIVGWNGVQWIDLSGQATATGNTASSYISGTMVEGISAIGIGKITEILIDNDQDGFLLYPNPVSDYININMRFKTNTAGTAQLVVFDAGGKRVIQTEVQYKLGVNLLPINVKYLSNGTYYINMIGSKNEKIVTGKRFIKQ